MAGDMSIQNLWNRLGVQPGNQMPNYNSIGYSAYEGPTDTQADTVYNEKLANWQSAFDKMAGAKPAVDSEALANRGAESLAASHTAATNTLNEQAAASGFDNSGAKMAGLSAMATKFAGLKANNERDAQAAGDAARYAHAQELSNLFLKKPTHEYAGNAYGAKAGAGGGSGGGAGGRAGGGGAGYDSNLLPRVIGGGTGLWSDEGGAGMSKMSGQMADKARAGGYEGGPINSKKLNWYLS